jgi:antitoxin component YwqK of YwqJK toxin-antitoxin module
MEYKTYENGVLVGGMLCYYGENGEIESTEIYKIQELTEGSVISYYDTSGTLIATSGYKDTYDEKGNLVQSKTYTDGSFETVSAMVTYSYEWIALT